MICLRSLISGCLDFLVTMSSLLKSMWILSMHVLKLHPLNNDDEDVVMNFFVASLVENARKWYNNLPDKSIKTWKYFHDTFMNRWGTKRDGRLLLAQFNEMKKKENESVK
jgi:hypothetical protein